MSRSTTSVGEREFPRITDGIIANLFSRRNGASQVLDENGEPMVVWHGSTWNPASEPNGAAVFRTGEGET